MKCEINFTGRIESGRLFTSDETIATDEYPAAVSSFSLKLASGNEITSGLNLASDLRATIGSQLMTR